MNNYFKPINIQGNQYGSLTVLERVGKDDKGNALWDTVCSCGNHRIVRTTFLTKGYVSACEECAKKKKKNHATPQSPNLLGLRIGKLVVVEKAKGRSSNGGLLWRCKCDCGEYTIKRATALIGGKATMCPSCANKQLRETARNNGQRLRNDRLYHTWSNMKRRCGQTGHVDERTARYYKERGIKVCEEWLDYNTFAQWAKQNGYNDNMTIERIDVDKGYSPDNCRWAHPKEQGYNKRNTIYIYYKKKRISLARMIYDLELDKSKIFNYLSSNFCEEINDDFTVGTRQGQEGAAV